MLLTAERARRGFPQHQNWPSRSTPLPAAHLNRRQQLPHPLPKRHYRGQQLVGFVRPAPLGFFIRRSKLRGFLCVSHVTKQVGLQLRQKETTLFSNRTCYTQVQLRTPGMRSALNGM